MTTLIYESQPMPEDRQYRSGSALIYVTATHGGIQVQIHRERQGGLQNSFSIASDEFIPEKFVPLLKLDSLRLIKTLE